MNKKRNASSMSRGMSAKKAAEFAKQLSRVRDMQSLLNGKELVERRLASAWYPDDPARLEIYKAEIVRRINAQS